MFLKEKNFILRKINIQNLYIIWLVTLFEWVRIE